MHSAVNPLCKTFSPPEKKKKQVMNVFTVILQLIEQTIVRTTLHHHTVSGNLVRPYSKRNRTFCCFKYRSTIPQNIYVATSTYIVSFLMTFISIVTRLYWCNSGPQTFWMTRAVSGEQTTRNTLKSRSAILLKHTVEDTVLKNQ